MSMTEKEALHTAARRFCIDRMTSLPPHLHFGDQRLPPRTLPAEFWARIWLLDAVLLDIEAVTPDDFATTDALREYLLLAGSTAQTAATRRQETNLATAAVTQDQRDRFCTYVATLGTDDLREVQPLPYRRLLNLREERRVWATLDERWGTNGKFYWYPLQVGDPPGTALAFQAEWFKVRVPTKRLHQILEERGIRRVWALMEGIFAPAYEMDTALLDPEYRGDECYWTAGEMDWLLYVSHESSITVAGDWFVDAIKATWPDWQEHVYTGWDYVRPAASEGCKAGESH
jgi:hypothetical protein